MSSVQCRDKAANINTGDLTVKSVSHLSKHIQSTLCEDLTHCTSQNAIQLRQVHPRCQQGNNTPAAPKLPEHTQEQLNAIVIAQKLNLLRIPQVSKKKRVSAANDENVTFNRCSATNKRVDGMMRKCLFISQHASKHRKLHSH